MSALALIDGVLPWVSESARADLLKARAALTELTEATTAYSRSVGNKPVVVQMARLHRMRAALAAQEAA